MVRAGPARWLVLLRRRGECRRELPATRRHGVDHRQGRPDHGSARRGDHRTHRPGSGRALSRSLRASSARRTTRASMRRRPRSRRPDSRSSHPPTSRAAAAWQASRSRRSSPRAPGNGAPIGGLKVVAPNGWFAARPSGTEDMYKIYAESFRDPHHLDTIVTEAQAIVRAAIGGCR